MVQRPRGPDERRAFLLHYVLLGAAPDPGDRDRRTGFWARSSRRPAGGADPPTSRGAERTGDPTYDPGFLETFQRGDRLRDQCADAAAWRGRRADRAQTSAQYDLEDSVRCHLARGDRGSSPIVRADLGDWLFAGN